MGALGLWFMGEVEQEKKEVLIKEVAKLYKIDEESVKKGFEFIEKNYLQTKTKD